MPAWGRRQSYPAVVWTTTLLAGVFALAAWLRPFIPEPEPNPIVTRRGQFMANASQQRIRWRSLEDSPFAEARRTDRLVVMVVGCTWSWQARAFDKNVLLGTEVAERLNREFIPVRVDATIMPEWSFGPFPLGSSAAGVDPGWYLLVLRPDGHPLIQLTKEDIAQRIDIQYLQTLLSRAQGLKRKGTTATEANLDHQAATESVYLVGEPSGAGGDLNEYAAKVAGNATSDHVFFEQRAFHWHPWEWRFLLSAGLTTQAEIGLRSVLKSSLVDWLYGGLFRTNANLGPKGVMFEKVAIENAEMANVLALLAVKTGDNGVKAIAEQTFDAVVEQFVTDDQIYAYSYADVEAQGRNSRYSARPKLIRDIFAPVDIAWLQSKLDLKVVSNPAMVVRVPDLENYLSDRPKYEAVFTRLKASLAKDEPVTAGSDLAYNVGSICARLIETARVLGDRARMQTALSLYPRIADYAVGTDGVLHSLKATPDLIAYLGDYTAYADACLQEFLTTGDTVALESGSRVLARAFTLFGRKGDGVIGTIPFERALPETQWMALPDVVDGSQGSLTGDLTRLSQAYSLVKRDLPEGKTWRESALDTVARYSVLTTKLNFRLGDLAHSMVQVSRDQALVVVGPNCVARSLELAKRAGDTLVFPAVGDVRKDVQRRGPGLYSCQQDSVRGPLTIEAALASTKSSP